VKVGILTFHHAANYGAVWQATSLAEAISGLGHSVEMIDYRPPAAVRVYRKAMLSGRHIPWNILKSWKLSRDLRSGVKLSPGGPITDRKQLNSIANRYEAVVVGSDEVWNIEGMRGWDPTYFLDFAPDHVRKISYAASTGHKINPGPHLEDMQRFLSRFHAISVRDETSANIVQEINGQRPAIVVDPTLLAGARNPLETNKDLVVYGGLSTHAKIWLRSAARKQNLRVLSIGFSNRVGGGIRIQAGLNEWLQTIGSANCVITTTFHGVLASIVHQRPFWVLPRVDPATKVKDFLKACNLNHLVLDERSLPGNLSKYETVDYGDLWALLKTDQMSSMNFLAESLR
jgi:hypothetical protein